MKTGEKSKLVRSLRLESQRFRLLIIVVGGFLVTLTFIVVSKPDAILSSSSSPSAAAAADDARSASAFQKSPRTELSETKMTMDFREISEDPQPDTVAEDNKPKWDKNEAEEKEEEEPKHKITLPTVSNYTIEDSDQTNPDQLGVESEKCDDPQSCSHKGKHKLTLPTISNYTINDSIQTESSEPTKSESRFDTVITLETNPLQNDDAADSIQPSSTTSIKLERKPLCDFSNFRANVCEMDGGEIRVHPKSASIVYMESDDSKADEIYKIKPYPRKGDEFCLSHVTELTVKSSKEAPQCTKHHDVPALVFSISGYTGNLFHDFTDVLVPLFTTANQFNGEVQLVITDMHPWWVIKYQKVLQKLSNYPLIDFSKDDQVHCFKSVIVGLHAYKEFRIDSSKAPKNYSMADFNRFMRRAFSVEREATTPVGENPNKKPKLLIISRKRTRMFLNLNEIIGMAEELGFEVVVNEADVSSDLSRFARIVNSCDVMMGVHGAGLTNCVFLPPNATLIQIVPWGGLDWIARLDFGDPANQMGLRYSQYGITPEESSLLEQYPRDHEIFKNPFAFHKRGFDYIRRTFMDNQNVRLDVKRFRKVLVEALDQLNP
ncbi:uncharacterized protein LOC109710633 [Ananas comosus]|uniref:Uncharacterized protein LOC109710633 n=1 Tax=Ananas comosus TaxID=4615 RepID=A0A6P5F631_ANACO|nr:uncharacterized protein LOC109710633 [Ananas comosus]